VGNRLIRDLSKMETPWDVPTVYRLLASPQWQSKDCLLPTDPAFLSAGHRALADALFHPCPEPPPDLENQDDDAPGVELESQVLAGLPPETLATLHPYLQSIFSPASTPPAKKSSSATPPRRQREMSAKLARKPRLSKEKHQLNQKASQSNKKGAKNSASSLATRNSARETPEQHESLFDRLRRQWAKTKPASVGRESEAPAASKTETSAPEASPAVSESSGTGVSPVQPPPANQANVSSSTDAGNQPPETENPAPETPNPELETVDPGPPDPNKPLNPFTHPGDYLFALTHGYRRDNPPKHIPDRRWEEDFGNPRRRTY
jgi:hypothetical protein